MLYSSFLKLLAFAWICCDGLVLWIFCLSYWFAVFSVLNFFIFAPIDRLFWNNKETHTDKKCITLTHHNKSTQKIAKTIKKLEYNIAYTTNNTLKRHLTNKTTHTIHEKHISTGVYKLKCNDCPNYYIGQTGRSFKTRYTEHIKALTQPLIKSNFA